MLHTSPDSFGKDLSRHIQRLEALKLELQERQLLEKYRAAFDKLEKDTIHLATRLSEARQKSWSAVKADFEGAWNAFITDLESLKLALLETQSAGEQER